MKRDRNGCSLRELARRLGVDEKAVRKAIPGRIPETLIGRRRNGRPFVRDVAGAIAAWSASSRTGKGVAEEPDQSADIVEATTLVEAQRRATVQRERKLRIDNDIREGRLIPLETAQKEAFEAARTIRENLLNLPARVVGELRACPDEARMYLKLDSALREALGAASDALLAANG